MRFSTARERLEEPVDRAAADRLDRLGGRSDQPDVHPRGGRDATMEGIEGRELHARPRGQSTPLATGRCRRGASGKLEDAVGGGYRIDARQGQRIRGIGQHADEVVASRRRRRTSPPGPRCVRIAAPELSGRCRRWPARPRRAAASANRSQHSPASRILYDRAATTRRSQLSSDDRIRAARGFDELGKRVLHASSRLDEHVRQNGGDERRIGSGQPELHGPLVEGPRRLKQDATSGAVARSRHPTGVADEQLIGECDVVRGHRCPVVEGRLTKRAGDHKEIVADRTQLLGEVGNW